MRRLFIPRTYAPISFTRAGGATSGRRSWTVSGELGTATLSESTKAKSSPEPKRPPTSFSGDRVICGVDEAGRGPVIGPLVVCGVACGSDVPLRQMNVRDSKKLSAERREALVPEIQKCCTYELLALPAEDIDAMRKEMTLNDFEAKLFAGGTG